MPYHFSDNRSDCAIENFFHELLKINAKRGRENVGKLSV